MTNLIEIKIGERGPFADGHEFGSTGAYERLAGRAHFAIDPKAPAQRGITDLEHAALDAEGHVRFAADIAILRPKDLARGNKRLFLDYGNRGNKRVLQFFNDAPASNDPRMLADAGNGFLMRRGYSIVWIAWQGDLLPGDGRMVMDLPVATDRGKPITGLVRVEYIADQHGVTTLPLSGWISTRSHPTVSLDTRKASLTRRRYERVYSGRDPLGLGRGHVAVRDCASFLKYGERDAAGNPNPLREGRTGIAKAYAWGRSQTGRCIRDFVHRGFNADAQGRRVFDGVLPHVSGGGLMWLNHRFANAVSPAGQQYEDHYNPADRFPFSYAESTDHLTGKRDAILKRPETDPLVIHTQTATEYWQRKGSLVHTDTRGNDLAQPETVRVYAWASSQHFADP